MFLTNEFKDPWEKSIDPRPECLTMSEETWFKLNSLREQFTMQFIDQYARRESDKGVIDAYKEKCLADRIIIMFVGEDELMYNSESKCIQYCETHFGYRIPALHGYLKPEHRSVQEQIDEIEGNCLF